MDVAATVGLGLIGFLIGNLLFSKVATWIATLYAIAADRSEGPRAGKLAIAFFLSAGPWFLVAVGVFAALVYSEPWAMPIFAGAVVAILFFSLFTVYFVLKSKPPAEGET